MYRQRSCRRFAMGGHVPPCPSIRALIPSRPDVDLCLRVRQLICCRGHKARRLLPALSVGAAAELDVVVPHVARHPKRDGAGTHASEHGTTTTTCRVDMLRRLPLHFRAREAGLGRQGWGGGWGWASIVASTFFACNTVAVDALISSRRMES